MKKNDIEDIYSELRSFSKEPPKELWDNIEERLHPKRKRKGFIWFWGTAAAILLMLFGYVLSNSFEDDNNSIKQVTDANQTEDSINQSTKEQATKEIDHVVSEDANTETFSKTNEETIEINKKKSQQNQLADTSNPLKQGRSKESKSVSNVENNTSIIKGDTKAELNESYVQHTNEEGREDINNKALIVPQKDRNKIIDNASSTSKITDNDSISKTPESELLDLRNALLSENKHSNDSLNIDVLDISKWSVEVLGGISNTASESTFQNTKVNTITQNDFVYTLKVGYAISDRLVIKSGIGKNILGQEISNIQYASSSDQFSPETSQSITDNESFMFFGSQEASNDDALAGNNFSEGNLQQQFDYIQVPLEISYKILAKKKYDISIGFGGNVNFVTSNKAFLDGEEIGENLDVNKTIFGATLNTNISYELTKKWILFMEPSYNYFQKPIDNERQSFSNTQLRLLFGLQLKL